MGRYSICIGEGLSKDRKIIGKLVREMMRRFLPLLNILDSNIILLNGEEAIKNLKLKIKEARCTQMVPEKASSIKT